MLRHIWIILQKESLDNLRDRRSLGSSMIWVLFNPLFFIIFLGVVNSVFSDQVARVLYLPVVGENHAPNLIGFLEQHNVVLENAPSDPEAAVKSGQVDLVLLIPEDYAQNFDQGQSAPVQMIVDRSNQGASVAIRRLETLLTAYSQQVGTLRLLARGVDPQLLRPLDIKDIDVSTEQSRSASLLSVLPLVLLLAAFTGGLYLAIDATAGERERGSLEPLLINPVRRRDIVLGKFLATFLFTLIVTILTLLVFVSLLNIPAIQIFMGIKLRFEFISLLLMFLVLLPVILLGVSLQILVASFAKSFKEAQTYVSYLIFLPVLPGLFLSIIPFKVQLWMMLVPIISQLLIILSIFRGDIPDWGSLFLASLTTSLVGAFFVSLAIHLYERERILFGR